ncbi:MAG: tRNA pseudouridine(38-40) synthase TruA [Ruminococcaceae bacterium]|nr:tRNA pseudouridine(38-40) synthase TruA [Oscillospiraceae bacterium]
MKILLHISYVGTAYCGYQVQPNGVSVQQKLNEAAKKLFGYDCDIIGCSRTDSGVHANHFCAVVTKKGENSLDTSVPVDKIAQAMTFWLPEDISVRAAEAVNDNFHPRYDVKLKEYVYKIYNSQIRDPFLQGRVWHCPKKIDDNAFMQMQKAAKAFVGKQDFSAFMSADSTVKDTVREVYSADVEREGDLIIFRVSANGFLYNMVRIFTGTLIDVAYGKLAAEDIPNIIASKDRKNAGGTAPPQGLYLNKVEY